MGPTGTGRRRIREKIQQLQNKAKQPRLDYDMLIRVKSLLDNLFVFFFNFVRRKFLSFFTTINCTLYQFLTTYLQSRYYLYVYTYFSIRQLFHSRHVAFAYLGQLFRLKITLGLKFETRLCTNLQIVNNYKDFVLIAQETTKNKNCLARVVNSGSLLPIFLLYNLNLHEKNNRLVVFYYF